MTPEAQVAVEPQPIVVLPYPYAPARRNDTYSPTMELTKEGLVLEDGEHHECWVLTVYRHAGPSERSRVATLAWDPVGGEVVNIWVSPGDRRLGIATDLWHRANAACPPIRHSRERTALGEAWARSLGEPLPPLELV